MIKLVVDMMGSDNGTKATVPAVLSFSKAHPDVMIYAVGRKEEMHQLDGIANIVIEHSKDVVPMQAGALQALRMTSSSMLQGLQVMMDQKADAIVSAGSTGAYLTAATVRLRLLEGVKRAALIAPFPSRIKGKKVVILDIGASNENSSDELVQFAKIGAIFYRAIYKTQMPKVYLLSNGTEIEKGSPVVKDAHQKLLESNFVGFEGNIEARDALDGKADVVVCDGFNGNIFLKSSEGMAKYMSSLIKGAFKRNIFSKIGYIFARKGFNEIKNTMDYESTGGAMLLGVNGVVVKAHGNANAYSFSCALEVAYSLANQHVNDLIKEELKKSNG